MNNLNEEGMELLHAEKIKEFNTFRMKNLTFKPNLSNQDLAGKNLSFAFLNGALCINTNFSNCILKKANLVQAELNKANFDNSDLTSALFMYAEMKECKLRNCNMYRSNFMWANLQNSDLSNSNITNTIFIEANLQHSILNDLNKNNAYIKYAKMESTSWK
jgi:uncharacterized protein YjbI with pentapeptide repeats